MDTLLSSRKASTKRIYNHMWAKFAFWCCERVITESKPKVRQVFQFLQEGLSKGLNTNILKQQLATISSILGTGSRESLFSHPHIKRFIRGVALIKPLTIHRYLSWNLNSVLRALMGKPFELLANC